MMRRTFVIAAIAFAVAFVFGASGCGNKEEQGGGQKTPPRKAGPAPAPTPGSQLKPSAGDSKGLAEAKKIFKMQCAQCHGESGRGDGLAAAQLDPKPRNYTDKKWQKSVTDKEIRDTILKGGAAMGKSPLMPANPNLHDKPEVLDGMVELVRSFAK